MCLVWLWMMDMNGVQSTRTVPVKIGPALNAIAGTIDVRVASITCGKIQSIDLYAMLRCVSSDGVFVVYLDWLV